MTKVKVGMGQLNDLLYCISISDEFCALCPNCHISCPHSEGTVAKNSCRDALYKYLQGEKND